jgi:hypothetical protein
MTEELQETKEVELKKIKIKGEELDVDSRIFEHFNSKTKAELSQKLEPLQLQIRALEERLAATELEKEEIKKSTLTASQLQQHELQKRLEDADKALKELDFMKRREKQSTIDNSILREFGNFSNLHKPSQATKLFKSDYEFDILKDLSGRETIVAKQGDEVLPLSEAIKLWADNPDNSNQFTDSLVSGNNTQKTGKTGSTSKEDILSMPGKDFLKSFENGDFNTLLKKS